MSEIKLQGHLLVQVNECLGDNQSVTPAGSSPTIKATDTFITIKNPQPTINGKIVGYDIFELSNNGDASRLTQCVSDKNGQKLEPACEGTPGFYNLAPTVFTCLSQVIAKATPKVVSEVSNNNNDVVQNNYGPQP